MSAAGRKFATLRAKALAVRAQQQDIEDLRDDVLSIVRNSGLSYAEIQTAGGACGATISAWQERKVKRPQLPTIRGTLRACGHDIYILKSNVVRIK